MYYGTKNALHPLLNIFLSIFILFFGLFMKDLNQIIYYISFIIVVAVFSGYILTLFKTLLIVISMSSILALISYLITQDLLQCYFIICRFAILGLCIVFSLNINPTDLSRSLNQLHCPRKVSLAILITYRFIPVLKSEISKITEAMKVRGVKFHWWNPLQYYRVLFLPMIIRIINISDTLALSIETRGFSIENQSTFYRKVLIKKKDIFITFLTNIGTLTILIMYSV
jgi:energy-coupling factor transport system permease protein